MSKITQSFLSWILPAAYLIGLGNVAWQFPVEYRLDAFIVGLVITAALAWLYGALKSELEFENHFFAFSVFVLPFSYYMIFDSFEGGCIALFSIVAFKTLGGYRKIFQMLNLLFRIRFTRV